MKLTKVVCIDIVLCVMVHDVEISPLPYVPCNHGSHGSPKRSAPCGLVNFCLRTQVLLSIITFRHGLSRYPLQTVG